ncbi:uncharacterized protein AMSG_04825 [Thecamonas trahens ATCC 50062]|uniref:DUF7630 domain-containing protein n=1 Tax=Thecamonas trahens ATCC 50062 TaxID=461836 RepID=A0A0L0D7L3_THETB|nr:hypothetical protein AMSG_04825 [Thecamonas trahens ATCC 50062]KNC48377.1 hypothetical protein AMSG_04825 [Thecamonas trahens ATCC 50062]|eukprot:XP_013758495.1 hypothetical protein AMSG_04825 [Thecamonas trahens ATCC 50062]
MACVAVVGTVTPGDFTGAPELVLVSKTAGKHRSPVVADFDGEGLANDLAIFHITEATAVFNNGSGLFAPGVEISTALVMEDLGAGKINADAYDDIVVVFSSGEVRIYTNTGSGGFSLGLSLACSGKFVAVADVDGSGLDDLVLTGLGLDTLLWRNDGTGGFPANLKSVVAPPADVEGLVVADLTNDGVVDIITTRLSGGAWLIEGLGGGAMSTVNRKVLDISIDTASLVVGDANGDGALDLVTSRADTATVSLNSGATTFGAQLEIPVTSATIPGVVLGEINGDGLVDVVIGYGDGVIWYSNNVTEADDMQFAASPTIYDNLKTYIVLAADLNGDAAPDIIFADNDEAEVVWIANDGSGTFSSVPQVVASGASATTIYSIAPGDIDNNGDVDLVWTGATSGLYWARNLGRGQFDEPVAIASNVFGPIVVADINHDGLVDIVHGRLINNSPSFYLNLGGTFAPPVDLGLSSAFTRHARMGDVTGDGLDDLVVAGNSPLFVAIVPGAPGGLTTSGAVSVTATAPTGLALADFNLDGRLDIAVGSSGPNVVTALFAQGGTTFSPAPSAPVAFAPFALAAGRIDDDLAPDLVLAGGTSVAIVFNDGTGGFLANALTVASLPSAGFYSVALADLNGDLFMDVMFSSFANAPFRVWTRNAMLSDVGQRVTQVSGNFSTHELSSAMFSLCFSRRVEFAPGAQLRSCSKRFGISLPASSVVMLAGDAGQPAQFDCGPTGGSLLSTQGVLAANNVVFSRGTFGAGVTDGSFLQVSGSSGVLRLTNVTVQGASNANSGPSQAFSGIGAGVIVAEGAYLLARSCVFADNTARLAGGAVGLVGLGPRFEARDTVFLRNTAHGLGAVGGGGGAVAVMGPNSQLAVTGSSRLEQNVAPSGVGGALLVTSAAESADISLVDATIVGNSAGVAGGGLAVRGAEGSTSIVLSGSTAITSCTAGFGGGLASVAKGYSWPSTVESTAVIRGQSVPLVPSAGAFVLNDSASVTDCVAPFGSLGFVCDAVVSAADTSGLVTGSVMHCVPSGASDAPPAAWFVDRTGASGGEVVLRTPPVTLAPVDGTLPAAVVSGEALGSGLLEVRDAYGAVATEAGMVALVTTTEPESVLENLQTGAAFDAATGQASLSPLVIAVSVPSVPSVTGRLFRLDVSVRGVSGAELPETSVYVNVTLCPPGKGRVSPFGDELRCAFCSAGSFSDDTSGGTCEAIPLCPANTIRLARTNTTTGVDGAVVIVSTTPCVCKENFYTLTGRTDVACVACPEGGRCPGGVALPEAAKGFYPSKTNPITEFVRCRRSGGCAGAGVCNVGYEDYMCNECSSGYYTDPTDNCAKCPLVASVGVIGVFVAIMVIAIGAALTIAYRTAQTTTISGTGTMAAIRRINVPATVSMAVVAFQVVGIVSDSDFGWDSRAKSALSLFNAANVDLSLTASECSVGFYGLYVLSVTIPFLLLVLIVAGVIMLKYFGGRWTVFAPLEFVPLATIMDSVIFSVAPVTYIPMARAVVALFDCTRLPGSVDFVLDADPGVACFDSRWWTAFPLGLAALISFVVGVPVYSIACVIGRRHELFTPLTYARYGALYRLFRIPYYWVGVADLGKRLALVVAAVFFSGRQLVQSGLMVVVLLSYAFFVLRYKPYFYPLYNEVDFQLTLMLVVFLLLGVGSYAEREAQSGTGDLFFVGVMLALAALFGIVVYSIYRDVVHIRQSRSLKYSSTSDRAARLAAHLAKEVPDIDPEAAVALEAALEVLYMTQARHRPPAAENATTFR